MAKFLAKLYCVEGESEDEVFEALRSCKQVLLDQGVRVLAIQVDQLNEVEALELELTARMHDGGTGMRGGLGDED